LGCVPAVASAERLRRRLERRAPRVPTTPTAASSRLWLFLKLRALLPTIRAWVCVWRPTTPPQLLGCRRTAVRPGPWPKGHSLCLLVLVSCARSCGVTHSDRSSSCKEAVRRGGKQRLPQALMMSLSGSSSLSSISLNSSTKKMKCLKHVLRCASAPCRCGGKGESEMRCRSQARARAAHQVDQLDKVRVIHVCVDAEQTLEDRLDLFLEVAREWLA
jgi:hypothetical protein